MAPSTSAMVNDGSAAWSTMTEKTVAHPTPTFPCLGSPDSQATAGSISSAASPARRVARAAVLADRAVVAATVLDVATSCSNSTGPGPRQRRAPTASTARSVPTLPEKRYRRSAFPARMRSRSARSTPEKSPAIVRHEFGQSAPTWG